MSHSDDITGIQYHTYTPYTTSFNNNDEIRISIQSQDLYLHPADSYLCIEFAMTGRGERGVIANPGNFTHAMCTHMFSEMRYELNGVEIDRCKKPGIASLLKTYIACKMSDRAAFDLLSRHRNAAVQQTTYRMILPLRFLFGFCDDYNKIVVNSKHELILVRGRTDVNVYHGVANSALVTIEKIQWKIPHVTLNDRAKLSLLKIIQSKAEIPVSYRSWDLYELPRVMQTTNTTWNVKTTSMVTKPRYVIVAFQINRDISTADSGMFDACNISDIRLYLNNERYPYDDMNLNFPTGDYHELFNMWSKIQQSYYNGTSPFHPVHIEPASFGNSPIFAFDCSRSDERVKNSMVDVRIEMQARANFPADTTAYCLIIHDNLIRYSPATGIVTRDI